MGRSTIGSIFSAMLIGCSVAPALAAPTAQSGDLYRPAPDLARGAALYKDHCAMCHDNASGRTPPRAVIEQNTQAFVLSVLTQGVMRPMANGLSWADLHSLSAFLAKRQGGVATTALEAPLCTAKPPPM